MGGADEMDGLDERPDMDKAVDMDTGELGAGRKTTSPEVIALGELLVDFIQVGVDELPAGANDDAEPRALYARAAGGAPANVAAALAAQGVRAGFVGKVGDDPMGRYLLDRLGATGVDLAGAVADPAYATTLAFATLDPDSGGLAYSFARKPGADLMLREDELNLERIRSAQIVHVGSLSLAAEPARSATLRALREAHDAGKLVSCDPNARPHAWDCAQDMLDAIALVVDQTDLLKVSISEMELLTGLDDVAAGARELLGRGPRLVAVTLDENGAYLATRQARAFSEACPVARAVDTAGAGDTFWGATLACLLREAGVRTADDLDALDDEALAACTRYACAAASLSVERRGALGSAPTALQTAERLEEWGTQEG